VNQFEKKHALSVPENTGPRGLYKTILVGAVDFVEAARSWGGQPFVLSIQVGAPGLTGKEE
jgi:hypothetical protein